ncbi:MAG TPA: type II secretion system protein [Patescibacteria group bacterium]|nr:type II secretion system protein [Patescibacteria group bacterium]
MKKTNQRGFTLIEILVVIGIIALLAGIVLIAINPARQFAQSRNAQRWSDASALLNALGQNLADNRGTLCASISTATSTIASTGTSTVNLACLVPTYIPQLPVDPSTGVWTSTTDYNTGYTARQDSNGRITIGAPSAELGQTVSVTR